MDLQPKQREALDALLSGASMTEAAATAGVHRATLHNWCRENTLFRAALRDAQSQKAQIVLDGFRDAATKALETIESIMTDPEAPAAVRLRAATLIIQAVAKSGPYTQPAEPRLTTAAVDNIIEAAARVGSEEQILRETVAASTPESPQTEAQTPRSAPCPCGSGEKFKRCCGRGAPGVLHNARAA